MLGSLHGLAQPDWYVVVDCNGDLHDVDGGMYPKKDLRIRKMYGEDSPVVVLVTFSDEVNTSVHSLRKAIQKIERGCDPSITTLIYVSLSGAGVTKSQK